MPLFESGKKRNLATRPISQRSSWIRPSLKLRKKKARTDKQAKGETSRSPNKLTIVIYANNRKRANQPLPISNLKHSNNPPNQYPTKRKLLPNLITKM